MLFYSRNEIDGWIGDGVLDSLKTESNKKGT